MGKHEPNLDAVILSGAGAFFAPALSKDLRLLFAWRRDRTPAQSPTNQTAPWSLIPIPWFLFPVFHATNKRARLAAEAHPPIITSCGPVGSRKFVPRSWFSFSVAATSKSEIFTVRVHDPVLQ